MAWADKDYARKYQREYQRRWREANRERVREIVRAYEERNKEKRKGRAVRYRHVNLEKARARDRAWHAAHPEVRQKATKKWRAKNTKTITAWSAKRYADKRDRTPPWADLKAIKAIYAACPSGYHVDHIIPLRGKLVSGLHVPANLQYLPELENLKKGNKFGGIS